MQLRALVLVGLLWVTLPAQALTVDVVVRGAQYRVGVFNGTFEDNAELFRSQAWWGDEELTKEFVLAVGPALGFPVADRFGPSFGFTDQRFANWIALYNFVKEPNGGSHLFYAAAGKDWDTVGWAVAESVGEVPVPAAIWLFGSGLVALVGVSRRRKA
jgi:hypothetical protein